MAISQNVPRGPVTAALNFYQAPADGSAPFNHVEDPPAGLPQRNFGDDLHDVLIEDIRGNETSFSLDRDSFAVVQGPTTSDNNGHGGTDFSSDDSIKQTYYPQVEELLLHEVDGAEKIVIFDHTIRRADPRAPRMPVLRVHIDQTAPSAKQRVHRHLAPEEAQAILQQPGDGGKRYRIINVWRPLTQRPVESFPLAFASSATLADDDFVPVEHRYPSGYIGQTAAIRYNSAQKWYYLSGVTSNERILLECFDSDAKKRGRGGRVPHTAFVDPRTAPDAEARESIEVRALVFG